jgi:DNA modification methylase
MIICGDALTELRKLPAESVHCCITSPPYWGLRNYGINEQIGREKTPIEYVTKLVEVFHEVRRVLRKDGTLWLVIGDSYAGSGKGGNPDDSPWAGFMGNKDREKSAQASKPIIPVGLKPKDLVGIPWRVAFTLQADGWYLRQDIIWAKPNPMPESVTDRCTKSHEYIFLLAKSAKYYYNAEAIKEISQDPTNYRPAKRGFEGKYKGKAGYSFRLTKQDRNHHSVWTITTKPFREAHFATFPPDLVEPMIKAGCPVGGIVLDPFFGAGTTGMVAKQLGREFIGIELNPKYCEIAEKRIVQVGYQLLLGKN